jgi:hypothetical protein
MSNFNTAQIVEDIVWSLRLADYERSLNRARINNLFNGYPPYSSQQAKDINLSVNFNDMTAPKMAHDARRQFANAFIKPGNFFTVQNIDIGAKHKRKEWAMTITSEMNRPMKRSLPYFETIRSQFANVVLHGPGPASWDDKELWAPDALGVEDVLVPGNTTLTMKGLPFLAIFRPYTALQLHKLTSGPKVDSGWNKPMVKKAIEYVDKQRLDFGIPYSEIYSPEKLAERFKSDSGFYTSDNVPTIDCWDFYFYSDEGKEAGWRRRIVLDANWQLGVSGISIPNSTKIDTRGQFLYDSGDRVYAPKLGNIIHWQFGDLSAVAPFRYHSVRSLGFLLFAICHVQNRLRCKFNDALFEHMLQFFRVRSLDEAERALKINMVDKGFVDETVQFIPQAERWSINANLIEMGLATNNQLIGANTASYVQDYDFSKDQVAKTATQVMAEVHSTTALVSSALMQAYEYQKFQYYEIARRFTLKNSKDQDVRKFRVNCLKAGVPEEVLNSDCWDIEPERVMGGGNKMLEMAIADRLMAARNLFDPEPQRDILRDFTLAVTDDPGRTDRLVPQEPMRVTDSVHDAQLAAASLMMGLRVDVRTGQNHIEVVETLLGEMTMVVTQIQQSGGVGTPDQIVGLQNMANYISQHIQLIAQDKNEKARVKQYSDDLGKLMNFVKAFEQRLQEQQQAQAQQNGNGGIDPDKLAKLQIEQAKGELKLKQMAESHSQRTALRDTQSELAMKRDAEKHDLEMQKQLLEAETNVAVKDIETAANVERSAAESESKAE